MTYSDNTLTLAVAGSRKTQSIVEACSQIDKGESALVLTYTSANQSELRHRLSLHAGDRPNIEVSGWFSFLIRNFVRPFLPFLYPDKQVQGFDFVSPPQRFKKSDVWSRYFNDHGEIRKVHLPQLAILVDEASNQAGIRRLQRIYDRIFIDEVQDLCGYDLEVLRLLMESRIPVEMVGDIRQAILATNPQETKNKTFKFMGIWKWFQSQESDGQVTIKHKTQTWRCRPEIAKLADSLFDDSWGFQPTESLNSTRTEHDGIFFVAPDDVDEYVDTYKPLVLRESVNSAKKFSHLNPINFGVSKGLGTQHVLVLPTDRITQFLQRGRALDSQQAAKFYVAITRAEQSVAIALPSNGQSEIPTWVSSKTALTALF